MMVMMIMMTMMTLQYDGNHNDETANDDGDNDDDNKIRWRSPSLQPLAPVL